MLKDQNEIALHKKKCSREHSSNIPLITSPSDGKPGEKWMCNRLICLRPDARIDSRCLLYVPWTQTKY